jgi:hypothetical protein
MQILFKPRVCGKQLLAAFRKPADSPVESETPLFTWTVESLSTVPAGSGPVQS